MRVFQIAILGLVPVLGYAQMTPQYSSYTTWTTDGVRIYQTVVVDGQTTGSCSYTYPCNCDQYGCHAQCTGTYASCVGATHTPKINNVLDGIGGWSTGPSQNPFSYMSYQTTTSAVAPDGQLLSSQTEGTVTCSAIGILLDVLASSFAGKAQACGSNNGAVVVVNSPPKTAKCDASTTNIASASVGGSGFSHIDTIQVTTNTDNVLLLDLLGGPVKNNICTPSTGVSCYDQSYKAAVPTQYTGKSGNIIWNWKIFCSVTSSPDITGSTAQKISCP